MSITGYYDGTAVQVDGQLQINQRVIVIPIENEENLMDTAAGGLHKYADPSMIGLEKDAWREAMVKKHAQK
ncbi:MAG: hypothetical protein HDR05_16050 [Lachnospiraceae bacterium]|nr:hypothetical protein [Lachnospiraceae bacterium]